MSRTSSTSRPFWGPQAIDNLTLSASVASNALTIAVKTKAGTDATQVDFITVGTRHTSADNSTYNKRTIEGALSIVVSSGSTLGHADGVATPIYVYLIDNAGTLELGVSTKLFDEFTVQSSTAEGGAGGADSATVLYSTTARTNKAIRLIGRFLSNQTTAGTWAAVPQTQALGWEWQPAGLTASRALTTDADGLPAVSATTSTELGYLSGVTSALQTQINNNTPYWNAMTIENLTLAVSVASNALTIAVKTKAGTDATASDKCSIGFRHATATNATFNLRTITAALSLVISSGSTLGHANGVAYPIWVYLIDNSGTLELAVSTNLVDTGVVQSTTAEGGAGAADAVDVIYSATARSNLPIRLIGKLISNQTTAGTWAAVPQTQQIGFIDTPAMGRQGSRSNTAAAVGEIGETIYAELVEGSKLTLTNSGDSYNIISAGITLTPGWWMNYATCAFDGSSATSVGICLASIGTSNTTPPSSVLATASTSGTIRGALNMGLTSPANTNPWVVQLVTRPFYLATTTTYYLLASGEKASGSLAAYGSMWATRVR